MGMKNGEYPRVGVGVIVKRERKVLLGQRINSHGEGTWAFPGGHLEFGESLLDAAFREVHEETGLSILNPAHVATTNDFFVKEKKHYVTLFIEAEACEGDPRLCEPNKCLRWDWFEWANLPKPLFLTIDSLIKAGFQPIFSSVDLGEGLNIRQATIHDLSKIINLICDDIFAKKREGKKDIFKYEQAFKNIQQERNNFVLVLERKGELCGVLQLTLISNLTFLGTKRALIEGVRIKADLRGQGFGKRFIKGVISIAQDSGCKIIQLTTNKKRADSIKFYQSLGFEATHVGFKVNL